MTIRAPCCPHRVTMYLVTCHTSSHNSSHNSDHIASHTYNPTFVLPSVNRGARGTSSVGTRLRFPQGLAAVLRKDMVLLQERTDALWDTILHAPSSTESPFGRSVKVDEGPDGSPTDASMSTVLFQSFLVNHLEYFYIFHVLTTPITPVLAINRGDRDPENAQPNQDLV